MRRYTGAMGSGHALFMMKDGEIVGADIAGGTLDGTYEIRDGGKVDMSVTMKSPANSWLVTGVSVGEEPLVQPIHAVLSENFADGRSIPLSTSTGQINATFK